MTLKNIEEILGTEALTDFSDDIIAFFSQPEAEKIDDDTMDELAFEFVLAHKDQKDYDSIEAFYEALKEHHPKLEIDVRDFFASVLIKYYCFTGNREKLASVFHDWIKVNYEPEELSICLYYLTYYGYSDLTHNVIEKEFKHLSKRFESDAFITIPMANLMLQFEFEKLLLASPSPENQDWHSFAKQISPYGFESSGDLSKRREDGLSFNLKTLSQTPKTSKNDYKIITAIEVQFVVMMQQKGCPLPVAGLFWIKFRDFLVSRETDDWSSFFLLETASFNEFLDNNNGIMIGRDCEMGLILWSAPYLTEFAFSIGLFDQKTFDQQFAFIKGFKDELIEHQPSILWEFSFVHQWDPPAGITQEAHEAERIQFQESIDVLPKPFEMADLLKAPGFKDLEAEVERLIKEKDANDVWTHDPIFPPAAPAFKPDRKIKSNERVTVMYDSGEIKTDIKYKFVSADLAEGKCHLL